MINDLVIIVVLAVISQAVVDQLKKAFKFHSGKWYKNKINIKIVISILISLILCISYNIDLLSLLGMTTFVPLIGEIVTAVIISSGASSVHNILSEFENLRTTKKIESWLISTLFIFYIRKVPIVIYYVCS